MRMRSTETFTAITEDLMVDIAKVNEILQQPMTKKTRYTKGSDPTYNNKGKGIPEVVTSGQRPEVSHILPLGDIDNLDTVATFPHSVAAPTIHMDMAAYSPDLDSTASDDTAFNHTNSGDTFQTQHPCPTTPHMVDQRE